MDYATARPLILSGDVIGVMSRKGPLAWITRAVMALSGGEIMRAAGSVIISVER